MVRADSHGITRAPWYSRHILLRFLFFAYEAVTLFGCPFQSNSVKVNNYNLETVLSKRLYLTTSMPQRTQAITWHRFRLFPFRSPLHRESRCFLFLALLRCFSSRRWLLHPMYSDTDIVGLLRRVSPFGNLRIKAWLAAPRGFQQPPTSFIAS